MVLLLFAAIRFSGDPAVGSPTTLTITTNARPRVGVSVHAVYEPGSPDEQETAVGATDEAGETHWTPIEAGVASIRAAGQEQTVIVAGDGRAGFGGMTLWAVALAALVGLAGWSLRRNEA